MIIFVINIQIWVNLYFLVDFRGQGPSYAKAAIHLRTGSCRQQPLLSLQPTLNGINKWDGSFLCLSEGRVCLILT